MKLVVGLGNVGAQYARTRHNVGFMVVDQLAEQLEAPAWRAESKFKAELAPVSLPSDDGASTSLLLAKPHTMMNLSGEAVQRLMQFYKIAPDDVWVIFDDVDVPFGRMRLRLGGSSSGHQGINSLIRHIGADFRRVRMGISLNDRTKEPSEVYVLKPFNTDEQQLLPQVITYSADILRMQLSLDEPDGTTFDLLGRV